MTTTTSSGTSGSAQLSPTEIRLRLLENGYSPIPNADKACYMEKWPSVEITPEVIARWGRRHSRWGATGLRIEKGLAVLDFDIPDQELIDACARAAEETQPGLSRALIRYGSGAKEAWFIRCSEPFGRIATRRWLAPGTVADDGVVACLETFGGASARQFGSFGPHTRNPDGSTKISYAWADEESPLTVPLNDLPEFTKAELLAVVDAVERVLAASGWEVVTRSTFGESESERVYDLTDDMVFQCNDGVDRSLAELQVVAGEEGLRCSASWLEGPSAKRRDRCSVGRTHSGAVSVREHASGVTHLPAERADTQGEARQLEVKEVAVRLQRLADIASEAKQKRLNKISEADEFTTVVAKLLRSYAFCPYQQLQVLPIYADSTEEGMTLGAFRSQQIRRGLTEIGPRGGKNKINPADTWLSDREHLIEVNGMRMRPDMPRPLFDEGGRKFINTYSAPVHPAEPEGGEVFLALIEHLVPDPIERKWFLDWLAHKYQNPAVPGPGVVMVSRKQGAGRSTLFIILRQLFGSAYVRKVDGVTLTGDGGQSQYNTWLANSLMVQVDELFNTGTGMHLWQRKKAYDRIKGLIDPASRDVEIIQKTLNNYVTRTFTTFFMATNNPNALPLDEDDRRICVINNGAVMAEAPEVAEAVNSVREGGDFKPGFISAVADILGSRSLEGFDVFAPPPMFEGKKTMIALNMTDVGEIADDVIEELPGEYITRTGFLARVVQKLGSAAGDHKHIAQEARERLDKKWVPLNRVKVRENGSKADVWARDKHAANMWQGLSLAERSAALAAGENLSVKMTAEKLGELRAGLKVVK